MIATRRAWTFAQYGLLIISVLHVIQAIVGFILEPSFATGPDAPTVQILGMDYNGWHAVAGLALFGPGLFFCLRNSWAVLYLLAAAVAGALPGIWAFFSHQVAYVFTFPNNITDAVVHLVTATVMAAIAGVQIRIDGGLRHSLADLRAPR
ncbi:MAG: hypothetical protein K0R33_4130 [Mycobacterium sp.]|jgi:hypothetical protein|nr:hypothetical protein [Mycobacterium sp.]